MREIVKADLPFERQEMPRAEAIAFFRERGERFKVEILEGIDGRLGSRSIDRATSSISAAVRTWRPPAR